MLRRALCLASLVAGACTDSDVYVPIEDRRAPLDDKLAVSGSFCAERAQDLPSFLKVIFIIDRSNSMLVTDPNNRRIEAVREVVMRFVEDASTYRLRAGVELAVESFYGDVLVHTRNAQGLPGFSRDGAHILSSVVAAARPGSNTGYDKALATAFLVLDSDMARLPDLARARSRYEVVFLSDGMPFPDNCRGQSNSASAAVAGVERIAALAALHRVPVTVHTAFAADPRMFLPASRYVDGCAVHDPLVFDGTIGDVTRTLLDTMAGAGRGTFTQFVNGDAISFAGFELAEARRMYALSHFVASNRSSLPAIDRGAADSDGDGLTDEEERRLGSRTTLSDTDGDGIGDLLEWRFRQSGLDPLDPTDGSCSGADRGDGDGDGLRDCEEILIGTSRRSVDTDRDGLTDDVELRGGGDPRSASPLQDAQLDGDADGGSNADELRWHTDPAVDDVATRSRIAYTYDQRERPLLTGQACYDFSVANIGLASTEAGLASEALPEPFDRRGWNRLLFYMAESPYDDPLGDPLYRVACVDARFVAERDLKIPASGRFAIPPRRPAHTYRPVPVLRPNQAACQASVASDCGLDALWCRFEDAGCFCYDPPRAPGDDPDGMNRRPCAACANGRDDDGDGRTDFPYDPDCFDGLDDTEAATVACKNGLDDDDDGRVDWPAEPGCADGLDGDESDPAPLPQCSDGADNDGSGFTDFPHDPGCYAASDNEEAFSLTNVRYACSNGADDDGDGLVDIADRGCVDGFDVDEDGPTVCFFCERPSDNRPGQCDLGAGHCRPRAGLLPSGGTCTGAAECRGAPCVDGVCTPCLNDADCDVVSGPGGGVCDARQGWCLAASYAPLACAGAGDCPGGACDPALGYCAVDPYAACRGERDCRPGEVCSAERGFCLARVFATAACDAERPCATGSCDEELGWCLPSEEAERCNHDDVCPFGDCRAAGYCEQPTFVDPKDLDPEVDCLRAR